VCYPALSCMAVMIHRIWKKVLSCAAMQARCCCDSQNALRKVCYPCRQHAAVVIHRMLWWKKGVLSPAVMHCCCHDPQNALVEEGVHPCAAAARCVVIHRMLWCKEGVLSLPVSVLAAVVIHRMPGRRVCYPCAAMQARCCCDSQNALVQGRVCYPCAVMQACCS
jgi:hypothetical protein